MFEKNLPRYDALIDQCPRFERKGKNMVYTSANGHMFSQLNKAGELGIRFSDAVQKKYFDELNTGHFLSYGAKMKGYVLIPEAMWNNTERLVNMLNESYDYVMSLEPK